MVCGQILLWRSIPSLLFLLHQNLLRPIFALSLRLEVLSASRTRVCLRRADLDT